MLLVRDLQSASRLHAPPWMDGAPDLHVREDVGGRIFGIGDGRLVGPPASERSWTDLGGGYQGRVAGTFVPGLLQRSPAWCRFWSLPDQQGRLWPVPQILAKDGATLAIHVTYGPGWVPDLTPAQTQAVGAARWARQTITAAVEAQAPLEAEAACKAAADLLASVLHVSPEVLANLRLLDQPFILAVLRTGAGWVDDG